MEQYGKILIIAMPVFLLLILIEKAYGIYKGEDHVPLMDSISSISSGITNAVKDVLGLSLTFISYEWLSAKIALFDMQPNWAAYLVAFIAIDFYGYWTHRFSHRINFLWNKHAIHHSSEEFNLACALRQSISSFINLFTFLLIPAALLGVPPKVIAITLPIQLFLQFWYHTRYIKKLGFLEKILVTPSHHRVHHAINPEYLDKNHSQIFIFWDIWFGTFQQELDEVPAVFGITRPARTWNPIRINFQHLGLLIADAWRSKRTVDRLSIWFKPTGWRPEGFDTLHPVHKINEVFAFEKYASQSSRKLEYWAGIQLLMTLLLVSYLFDNIARIGLPAVFIYGLFIFVTIYSYNDLMDRNRFAVLWESIRFIFGFAILVWFGDWFGSDVVFSGPSIIISLYLALSLLLSIYFVSFEFRQNLQPINP